MAGIGEAATIIALVETGFSLARALNTYVSDVGEARDDILELASDIDATFRMLRDLDLKIKENEATKVWSEDGLANAKKCIDDADRTIKKMRKLLKKATASGKSPEVKREEIDVKKFERALWPVYKPELELRRRELQSIKQDILIAYTSYNAKAGATEADRQRARDDLPRLSRTRELVKQQVKDARRKRTQRRTRASRTYRASDRDDYYGYPRDPYKQQGGSDCDDDIDEVLDKVFYDNIVDLEQDFEDWAAEKAEKERKAEEEKRRLETAAVEDYKRRRREETEEKKQALEANRTRLRQELTRQHMAPQQIEDTLNHVYPRPQAGDLLAPMPLPTADQNSDLMSVSSKTSSRSKRRSIWSRVSSSGRSAQGSVSENSTPQIPSLLQDPAAPGGVAELKAIYYSRMLGHEGERIRRVNVELPAQWLLDKLINRESRAREDEKVKTLWKEFACLPDDYRYFITNELQDEEDGHDSDDSHGWSKSANERWLLVYVECLKASASQKRFLRKSPREDVVGVYVVLKRQSMQRRSAGLRESSLDGRKTYTLREKDVDTDIVRIKPHEWEDEYKPEPLRGSVMFRERSRSSMIGSSIAKRASINRTHNTFDDIALSVPQEQHYPPRPPSALSPVRTYGGARSSEPSSRPPMRNPENKRGVHGETEPFLHEYERFELEPQDPRASHRRSSRPSRRSYDDYGRTAPSRMTVDDSRGLRSDSIYDSYYPVVYHMPPPPGPLMPYTRMPSYPPAPRSFPPPPVSKETSLHHDHRVRFSEDTESPVGISRQGTFESMDSERSRGRGTSSQRSYRDREVSIRRGSRRHVWEEDEGLVTRRNSPRGTKVYHRKEIDANPYGTATLEEIEELQTSSDESSSSLSSEDRRSRGGKSDAEAGQELLDELTNKDTNLPVNQPQGNMGVHAATTDDHPDHKWGWSGHRKRTATTRECDATVEAHDEEEDEIIEEAENMNLYD